jgi:hypothetical protein
MSVLFIGPASLPVEVALPIVRDEERSNRTVGIKGAERPASAVKSRKNAASLNRFKNRPADCCVTQGLGQAEVFLLRDSAELAAMFGVVLVEQASAAEPRAIAQQA